MAKKKVEQQSHQEEVLKQLLDLLEKLSINVRYDRGFFHGGLVRYKDQLYLYLNRKSETMQKIETIISELKYIQIPEELISEDLKPYFQLSNQEV